MAYTPARRSRRSHSRYAQPRTVYEEQPVRQYITRKAQTKEFRFRSPNGLYCRALVSMMFKGW